MKKQILNEEFRRMQLLAGVITESQLNEAVEVPTWLKGKLEDVHTKPGQGSIFSKSIDSVLKLAQDTLDKSKDIDKIANSTGTLTVKSPGIGYNLVLPIEQAKKLPGAKESEVEKIEGPNKIKVPAITTTAPLTQFKSDELTVIVRPKKDESGTVIPNEYIVLSAFPGDPSIPRASEWNGKYAVVIPGNKVELDEFTNINKIVDEALKKHRKLNKLKEEKESQTDPAVEKDAEQGLKKALDFLKSKENTIKPDPKSKEIKEGIALTLGLVAGAPGLMSLLGKAVNFISAPFQDVENQNKGTIIGNALKEWGHSLEEVYLGVIGHMLKNAYPDKYRFQEVTDKTSELYDMAHGIYATILIGAAVSSGVGALEAHSAIVSGLEGGLAAFKTSEVVDLAKKIAAY
jgi:hypothetical protein